MCPVLPRPFACQPTYIHYPHAVRVIIHTSAAVHWFVNAEVTRTFNVFLPKGFKTTRTYPVWMHIHGVYWGSMDNISQRMGWNVLAMDATAGWDGLVGSSKVDNSAIVVYPQSTPSPYTDPSQRMVRATARPF